MKAAPVNAGRAARTLLMLEMRLQQRHGLGVVYVVVGFLYAALLRLLPAELRALLVPILIIMDPAMIGFMFFGAFFLIERDHGIPAPLAVTPVTPRLTVGARLVAFALVAVLSSGIVVVFGTPELLPLVRIAPAVLTIVVTSLLFGALGYAVALHSRSINHFFVLIAGPMALIAAPLLVFVPATSGPVWLLFPAGGAAALLARSLGDALPAVPWSPLASVISLLVWCAAGLAVAAISFRRRRDEIVGGWS